MSKKLKPSDDPRTTGINEPRTKRIKTGNVGGNKKPGGAVKMQSNLFAFFSSNVPTPPKKRKSAPFSKSSASAKCDGSKGTDEGSISPSRATKEASKEKSLPKNPPMIASPIVEKGCCHSDGNQQDPEAPIFPKQVSTPRNIMWQSLYDDHVIVRRPSSFLNKDPPRDKIAAFDLDGTLLVWRTPSWPHQLDHYELWNAELVSKLRSLYDDQGYKLVLFTNQGGIRKSHTGKKASLVKSVIDWLAQVIDRPVYAVMSTRSIKNVGADASFHKPSPKMWEIAIRSLNQRQEVDIASSFFVGDSADPDDEQGGVDAGFARAVGEKYSMPQHQTNDKGAINSNTKKHDTTSPNMNDKTSTLAFYTPTQYFGQSNHERRKRKQALDHQGSAGLPPPEALNTRSALHGGYLKGPLLLILCGVQGSGKSTFCTRLTPAIGISSGQATSVKSTGWVHLSQDTISNGKPGKRELVEQKAHEALKRGLSVVVDRMHLDPVQRQFFVQVARDAGVPAHVVLLNPPKAVIAKRVRERTNHPGKVEGADGARVALQSLERLVLPTYKEPGIQLISISSTSAGVARLSKLYDAVALSQDDQRQERPKIIPRSLPVIVSSKNNGDLSLSIPTISLGTMGIGKRIAKETVILAESLGFAGVDTAPTYKNEENIGEAFGEIDSSIFCIAKIPKSVQHAQEVIPQVESTLRKLNRSNVDLLLLHWPCDVIISGTLQQVWKEMEEIYNSGKCRALGVCNFNISALSRLLSDCTIPPVVNQVERHPLLSQMDLVDFCTQHDIIVQAHTPLGQGRKELLEHTVIQAVAQESVMSPAQVALVWNIQQGFPVVPKCQDKEHMKDVLSLRPLSSHQLKRLNALDKGKRFVAPPFMFGTAPYCWAERNSL